MDDANFFIYTSDMKKNEYGFGFIGIMVIAVILSVASFAGWTVFKKNQKSAGTQQAHITNFEECVAAGNPVMESNPEQCSANGQTFIRQMPAQTEKKLSSGWLLRKSDEASIRVPDGFNMLVVKDEDINFVLPDAPQGTLKYEEGAQAKIVGEPHKHFELGLIVSFNEQGFNDRGTKLKEFKTYSGLDVNVKLFEQTTEPNGVDFPKGTKHLKYTVTKGTDYFNVDYAYLGDGIVDIVEEMVRTITIE